jgi:2-C-methyl-D-erythritol 4-phosphate cytidylyltransferase
VRPLVNHDIISECIVTCKKYGSAVSSIRCTEAILKSDNGIISDESIPREFLYRTQTPQAFPLSLLLWAHEQAEKRGIVNSVASCTLMAELGQPIYLCNGSEKNIKITTIEDIEIVKALIKIENER